MDNDILYQIPENEAYKHIKQLVPKGSIKLAYCQLFFDLYFSKKTILNCLPILENDGKIIVECDFYSISKIASWLLENAFSYTICCVAQGVTHADNAWAYNPYVFIVINKKGDEHGPNSIITFSEPGDYSVLIRQLSNVRDNILCIGDNVIDCAVYCKKMCRHVVCFSNGKNVDNLLREAVKQGDV